MKSDKSEVMYVKGNKGNNKNKKPKKEDKPSENSDSKVPKDSKCNYCGHLGHWIKDCRKKKRADQNKEKNDMSAAVFESQESYANELFMCSANLAGKSWILDSGCTMHATPLKSYFNKIDTTVKGEVMLGDHTSLNIEGAGDVVLYMYDGKPMILNNVRWVPKLRRSLLSESVFDDQKCTIHTEFWFKNCY